jgi:hypothetical protein
VNQQQIETVKDSVRGALLEVASITAVATEALASMLESTPATDDGYHLWDGMMVWFTDDDDILRHGEVNYWSSTVVNVCDPIDGTTYWLNHTGCEDGPECWMFRENAEAARAASTGGPSSDEDKGGG